MSDTIFTVGGDEIKITVSLLTTAAETGRPTIDGNDHGNGGSSQETENDGSKNERMRLDDDGTWKQDDDKSITPIR